MRALIDRVAAAFDSLTSREQLASVGLAALLVLMTLGFGSYLLGRDIERREKRIAAKISKLKEVAELRSDYKRRLAEQKRIANQVKGNNKMRILSYLENLSGKAYIELKNASERQGEPTGSDFVKEEAAEVKITDVSLDRLHDFLRRIEEGNPLVKVRRLRVETRFDNPEMLDAVVTVGTFKTTGEGS